jgi:TusA-related sulfurtransferase
LRKGLAVIISPDDAFKYTSFYKDYLEIEASQSKSKEWDLSDLVCPLSKIKATEVLDSLDEGETVRIILGNTDSLTSVAQEIKVRGWRPGFEREGENRFVLTVTKS